MKTIIKHERYDETFKRSAVEERMLSGKSPGLIAKELEMNVQNLRNCSRSSPGRSKVVE